MILLINTSGNGLEFALYTTKKVVNAEKQSTALATECEKFIQECGITWRLSLIHI